MSANAFIFPFSALVNRDPVVSSESLAGPSGRSTRSRVALLFDPMMNEES